MGNLTFGGQGGQPFGPHQCPTGKYIKEFKGTAANQVDSISAVCNDGTVLPTAGQGKMGGGPFSKIRENGFESISGRSGDFIDNLDGVGGSGGGPFNMICPTGKKIVGFGGRAGWGVDALYFGCDYDENYCIDNLESPYCQRAAVSKSTLNKACAKSMSATCINRKNELDESLMINYCRANPNEDICACYAPVPSYIESGIAGLPQCWNNKCATSGYKSPNMLSVRCPDIKICKQSITSEGANILSSNVIKLDCSTTVVQPTAPPASGGTTTNVSSNTKPSDTKAEMPESSNNNLYILLFILFIVVILLTFALGDDNDKKYTTGAGVFRIGALY